MTCRGRHRLPVHVSGAEYVRFAVMCTLPSGRRTPRKKTREINSQPNRRTIAVTPREDGGPPSRLAPSYRTSQPPSPLARATFIIVDTARDGAVQGGGRSARTALGKHDAPIGTPVAGPAMIVRTIIVRIFIVGIFRLRRCR